MAYSGHDLNNGNIAVQVGTGDGVDTTPIATLNHSVGSSFSVLVALQGVVQEPIVDYTASGQNLVFTTAPANGVKIQVFFLGLKLDIGVPGDGTVGTTQLIDGSVTAVKLAPDAISSAILEIQIFL